jgi:hypothetical protein
MLACVRDVFEKIPDARKQTNTNISLADIAMSALSVFSLKEPSLLSFEHRTDKEKENLKHIYGMHAIPSDTTMREVLDEINSRYIRKAFTTLFAILQRGKGLEDMAFYEGAVLISLDGTGTFLSEKIHCSNCLTKIINKGKESEKTIYQHQLLGASIVHPDKKEVIPLCPEPIINTDGSTKNDCERNASKRWLKEFRREHPHLKAIIVADALASNAPLLEELLRYGLNFIIGVKPGSHAHIFSILEGNDVQTHRHTDASGTTHTYRFINDIALNEGNPGTRVNVIDYHIKCKDGGEQKFTWVTDFSVEKDNVAHLARGGRARWKIENETFNTLKNQGYNFEHNFGHGKKHLATVFQLFMMLAFLIDQIQQKCCPVFQAAWEVCKSKRKLWECLRGCILWVSVESMLDVWYHTIEQRVAPSG